MRAIFKKIGLIKNAEIDLDGITIVAAPNDSGKSTISKTLYMFLETIANFSEEYTSFRNDSIRDDVRQLFIWLNRTLSKNEMKDLFLKLGNLSDENTFLEVEFDDETDSLDFNISLYKYYRNDDGIEKEFQVFKDIYNEIVEDENDNIIKIFDNIINYFSYSDIEKFNLVLKSKIKSYFDGDLVSHDSRGMARVQLIDSKSENHRSIVQTDFSNDVIYTLEFQNNLNEYSKVLYLDSFVNLEDYPFASSPFFIRRTTNIRKKSDEVFKYLIALNEDLNPLRKDLDIQKDVLEEISAIIGGSVEKNAREIYFNKNNDRFSIKNTATGVKIFGALQLILQNYAMTPDLFIIIDEPETNLHPVWQVKLSELIVKLNKLLGIQFLINSHSSNFIEGIKLYSELHETERFIRFYLINSETQTLEDVTQNLQPAYDQLNGSLDILDEVARNILEKKERCSEHEH